MSARKFPTGLPLVDKLRSCMLQSVPNNQTSGRCSSLPYDAAELIHDLYDAADEARETLEMLGDDNMCPELAQALDGLDAVLAKARGETA